MQMTKLCQFFLGVSLKWIYFVSLADWGYFYIPRPNFLLILFYYGLIAALFYLKRLRFRLRVPVMAGMGILWCGVTVSFFQPARQDDFKMTLFSAGSNDLAHFQFSRENHWLMNAGRIFPGDQAEWIVAPYMRQLGVKRIKGIIFTDERKRHTAGFETLDRNFNFDYVVRTLQPKQEEGKERRLQTGDRVLMPEGAVLEVLDNSRGEMAWRILYEGKNFVFLPSVSYAVFQSIVKRRVPCDLLILPAIRNENSSILKSILTVLKPKAVAAPFLSRENKTILEERGIVFSELASEGAAQIRILKTAGGNQIELKPFLKTALNF
jgi:hypothetical protein